MAGDSREEGFTKADLRTDDPVHKQPRVDQHERKVIVAPPPPLPTLGSSAGQHRVD